MRTLQASRLTNCSVAADGTSVALGVADTDGREVAVVLPTECLKALIMTLPELMSRALRLRHRDPGLRLVYPAASWEIESSTEPATLILTLRTPDNFHVSFAVAAGDLQLMAEAAPCRSGDGKSVRHQRHSVH